jgi:signal transduction histidine kinase
LVRDIVSVQALETQTFNCTPINLVDLLNTVIARHLERAQAAELKIVTVVPPNPMLVLADPDAVSEALEKILDNALKFGVGGAKIEITLQDIEGPMMQVSVRDYGIGIDPAEQQNIFRRFYQVDGGTARRYSGTGLGLAIAKAIIEGHGGRIGVKSRLNEGATFIFTLPKHKAAKNGN